MTNWWLQSEVDTTVTRQFVLSYLPPDEAPRLDRQIAPIDEAYQFRRSYWESLQSRAKKLFLILRDLGLASQVFRLLDEGWDDLQLPLDMDGIARLRLTHAHDDRVDRRFHQKQYKYAIKIIDQGEHHNYNEDDRVPLNPLGSSGRLTRRNVDVDEVTLPNAPDRVFNRRKYPLGNTSGCVPVQEFLELVVAVKSLQNEHMVSYWGSYTHKGFGYILLGPVSDYSLKSFLSNAPASYKSLPKKGGREMIMNWILCLADTVCFIHSKNRAHSHIKPSAVLFTNQNHVFLADPTRITAEVSHANEKNSFDREWYDYAAPEQGMQKNRIGSPPTTRSIIVASLSVSPEHAVPNLDPATVSQAIHAQESNQQADIFSLGCIILELLSFLVKRSTNKFANYRSIKHKTAGRGGAVLDTSFHRHLNQVELWMTELAKDAAKRASDTDGGNVFRGFAPLLHVVAGMLATEPWDRPAASEVQERIYSIVVEHCGIEEPHCVHQYSELSHQFDRTHIQEAMPYAQPILIRPSMSDMSEMSPRDTSPPPLLHHRTNSSSGFSQFSRDSSITTGSSERSADIAHPGARVIPGLARFRRQRPDG